MNTVHMHGGSGLHRPSTMIETRRGTTQQHPTLTKSTINSRNQIWDFDPKPGKNIRASSLENLTSPRLKNSDHLTFGHFGHAFVFVQATLTRNPASLDPTHEPWRSISQTQTKLGFQDKSYNRNLPSEFYHQPQFFPTSMIVPPSPGKSMSTRIHLNIRKTQKYTSSLNPGPTFNSKL